MAGPADDRRYTLHGSGRRIENASEGITIQIEKERGADKLIHIYLYVVQDAQINLRTEDSKMCGIKEKMELPKYPHCAIICGQTGCGKTEFVLDLLEAEYRAVFEHIVILCPTIQWNKAYMSRPWIGTSQTKNKNIVIVNPINRNGEEMLQELLRHFFSKYAGTATLYIIDDCSATKELTKKKDMLSQLHSPAGMQSSRCG